jgi:hypothetical protein
MTVSHPFRRKKRKGWGTAFRSNKNALQPRKISLDMASLFGCELQSPAQLMGQAFDELQPHRLAVSGIEIHGKSNAIVLHDHAHRARHTVN